MSAIWIDNERGLRVGEVGFLVEIYRPGRGSTFQLRRQPLDDPAGRPTLDGAGQAWCVNGDETHPSAHGLAQIARRAKLSTRCCLRRVEATPELLEQLGYPELAA